MTDKNPDEQPTFFVSRRGRQVGVHQVDLTNMDIESDESTPAQQKDVKHPKASKVKEKRGKIKTARQPFKWSKKKIIVLAVVLIVLSLPVVAAELVVAQYRKGSESARQDMSSVVNKTVLPAQKQSALNGEQIRSMATQVNDIVAGMCRGGLLDNAAGLYPRAAAALSDCKSNQALYAALVSELYSVEKLARYLEAMDGAMKPVATPITDEFAVIGAQQSLWLAADEDLKKLSIPDEMRSAHASLSTHVTAVSAAWSALNTANNEQDAAGFTEAEKKLASEYEAIRTVSGEFSEVLNKAQSELLASYSKLK
jgi:hypothetical protein